MLKAIKNIFLTLFIFGLLIAIFAKPDGEQTDNIYQDDDYASPNCPEDQQLDNDLNLQTQRSWIDYYATDYCINYQTSLAENSTQKSMRAAYTDNSSRSYQQFWRSLYSTVHQQNMDKFHPLMDSLWSIKIDQNLNRNQFANMVVSFVQDIPYVYILDEERCEDQIGQMNCVTGVKYGLLSPYEFLHTLNGDCDTRSLLLYTLLKQFGYDPRIAISNEYAHAVLMLDVATSGDYIEENGQKYFFWETTATGWQSGILPPDVNDISKWEIII